MLCYVITYTGYYPSQNSGHLMDPYDDPSMSPYGNMYGSAAMLADPYGSQQRHRMMMQAGIATGGMGSPLSEHMLRNMDAARRSGGMRRDDAMMGMHGMPHHSMHGKQLLH
jgi:hypothetical protein